jgi:hypothetical protein
MKIIYIKKSNKKDKRFTVSLDDGREFNFGLKNGSTYLDHKDKNKRFNYWARHYGNEKEKELIDKLEPSNSVFSAYLLWGKYTNLEENIKWLNKKFSKDLVL